ncbi:MAG: DUF4476 domain-containing protein [Bacteroidales bacterium]|nr:DUF4476 domain-containing protein [Bacteroidales bacterium]
MLSFIWAICFFFSMEVYTQGMLSLISNSSEKFWVYVNGVQINFEPQYFVSNIPINAPFCNVKIVFLNPRIPSLEKVVSLVDPMGRWYHATFLVKRVKKWLFIIDDYDAIFELMPYNTGYPTYPQPTIGLEGYDYTPGGRIPPSGNQPVTPPTTNTPVYPPACMPMDIASFEAAKASISRTSFDDTRLSIAKQIASSNCLTAAQIRDIMRLFSFESTRLDFAKFAYPYCYDKGNYFMVNDAFSFSSSIDELNKFIYGH